MNALVTYSMLFAESWLGGLASDLNPSRRFVLLLAVIGCLTIVVISVVAIVTSAVQSMQRTRVETDIKREMLDRGMSADEIAKVVESATPKDFLERWAANQGREKSA